MLAKWYAKLLSNEVSYSITGDYINRLLLYNLILSKPKKF